MAPRSAPLLLLASLIAALPATTRAGPQSAPGADATAPRSLLLITVDTLRQDHLGCYGGELETPTFDGLAARGYRFTDAFATAPTTLPSHASLLTGVYPARHGVRLNGRYRLAPDALTLAEVLQQEGLATAAFVGTAVLSGFYGLDQGFDHYDDSMDDEQGAVQSQRRAGEVTRRAAAWLQTVEPPFFLWVHYFDPHGPYDPPPPWDERYYQGDPRSPEHDSMPGGGTAFYQDLEGITDVAYPLGRYKGEISYTDAEVGRLLEALGARGLAEETLTVMTADHGESLGESGDWFDHGRSVDDACMRVPLLVVAPWLQGGGLVEGPVSLVDVLPTVLALLDVELPEAQRDRVQGLDLRPHLDAGRAPRRPVFFETFLPTTVGDAAIFGLQTGSWKLMMRDGEAMLFDHASDPGETLDVGPARPERLGKLVERLADYARTVPRDALPIEPTDEQLEMLRALGYIR